MTHNATGSSNRARLAIVGLAGALLAGCAAGQGATYSASDNFAEAVPTTTVYSMNLSRDPIPPILVQARASPYATYNTATCVGIVQEMALLNAVLGEDYDTNADPARPPDASAERIAGLLIPFRGVIREVSGANRHEWEFRQAISAGLMRRAYLKGRGESLGCAYPARPYPSRAISDPTNFEDLGPPPPPQPYDPRRVVSLGS